MTTPKTIVIVLLAAGALALSAGAKVFWAWPAPRGQAVLKTTPDWKTIYTSSVLINDGQGDLTIIGCNEVMRAVMTKLRQAYAGFAMLEDFRQNDTMGLARVREGNAIITLLALAPNKPEQTLLFVLSQTSADFDKSRGPPSAPRLSDPKPYPGSRVKTYLTSDESQTQLEIYDAPAAPETVWAYYESTLLGQSWTRLDPSGVRGGALANLALFQKGSALCAFLALPIAGGAGSTITVLHKRLKME